MSQAVLAGVKIIELGQLIAGPFAAKMLGEFGAEVIKIEPPGTGDALRKWRMLHEGTSVWWQVQSRNKKSVSLDLREPEARDIVRALVKDADVLIENFRPGTMEEWGMGWEDLSRINPGLVMLRISGYGQTGPYKDLPGFGVIAEAMGGLRYLTAEPGRVPVRVGVSIGDTIAALHGVIGVLLALYHRRVNNGRGQVIDTALYESVFNVMESLLPEYSVFGAIREPSGSALPGIAPTNAYRCKDGRHALIAGNGDGIFKRLMQLINRADLADDPGLAQNDGRAKRADELDAAIGAWASRYTLEEVVNALAGAKVPAGKIYSVKDIAEDPQYRARDMIKRVVSKDGLTLDVPGIMPKLSETPGSIREAAPRLGEHTDEILASLGITTEQRQAMRARGII
ncbi:MAG: CaiB/BaiF CoA transferase family protein [Burkholderiales bacterium]